MEESLQTIIALLEEEKNNLLQFIQSAIREEEYLSAHAHSMALAQLNRKLLIFKNLEDINHDEKKDLEREIIFREKDLNTEIPDPMRAYFLGELQKLKQQLAELNRISKEPSEVGTSTVFDEVLIKLIRGKIKKFTVILNSRAGLNLEFSTSKNNLKLAFPDIKRQLKNYLLYGSQIELLTRLGFSLTNHDDKLVLQLPMKDMSSIDTLKTILARIVFEVFHFKEFSGQSFIKINK